MVNIRNEADFKNWFKKNYRKLGFSKIVRRDVGICPDFIMLEKGKRVKVELEIKSSNFLLHKHSRKRVDKIVCVKKDVEVGIPIIVVPNFKIVAFNKKIPYSLQSQVYAIFKKEKVVTSAEVAKMLDISRSTADSYLKDLAIEGKVERIKKTGVTLWIRR